MDRKEFRSNLKIWTRLQEKQNKYQKYLNVIKKRKNDIQPDLVNYMQNNKINDTSLNSNFTLKLNETKKYSFISKDHIKNILKKHIKNKENVDEIIKDIYSSRNSKINYNLNIIKKQ